VNEGQLDRWVKGYSGGGGGGRARVSGNKKGRGMIGYDIC